MGVSLPRHVPDRHTLVVCWSTSFLKAVKTQHVLNMSLDGKFVLQCNDNYDAWLKAVGVPDEIAAKMCAAKPCLEVCKTDSGMTVKTTSGDKVFTNTVDYGKDSLTDIAGLKYTLNVNQTSTGYNGTIKLGSKCGTFTAEACDSGFIQTVTVDGVTAKRTYKRQ